MRWWVCSIRRCGQDDPQLDSATLLDAEVGSVFAFGIDAAKDPVSVRAHIGLAGLYASVDGLLTGQENLESIGKLLGPSDRAEDALRQVVGSPAEQDESCGTVIRSRKAPRS